MSSQWKTDETPALLWFEQANNAAVTVGAISYGVHVAIFFQCTTHLIREKKPKYKFWLALITALFILGSINICMNLNFSERAWIDFRNYPGGPLAYLLEQQAQTINTIGNAASMIATFIADGLLLYRCYVVWRIWYILVVPSLMYIAATVLSVFLVVAAAQPASSLFANVTLKVSIPYWSVSMTLSMVLTILLVTRLLYMRHQVISAMGSSYGRMYASIASMLVESALPYGLLSFIFIILYGIGNTAANLFIPLLTQVECIAPMLIVLRVSRGDAMTSDTVQRAHTMSTSGMQFAANDAKTNEVVSGVSFPNGSSKTAFSSARKFDRDPAFHLKTADFPVGTEFHVTQFEEDANNTV